MIIWKGRGWLVLIIGLMSTMFSMPCANSFVRMTMYENETAIQIGIALLYAGVFIRTIFLFFPAKEPRHFIDADTGQDVYISPVDQLYYIDVKYWAYGFIGVGILVFVVAFVTALL